MYTICLIYTMWYNVIKRAIINIHRYYIRLYTDIMIVSRIDHGLRKSSKTVISTAVKVA